MNVQGYDSDIAVFYIKHSRKPGPLVWWQRPMIADEMPVSRRFFKSVCWAELLDQMRIFSCN